MADNKKLKMPVLMRKIHFWVSLFVIVPMFLVTTTGLVLMVKKDFAWIQPPTQKGIGKTPTISFQSIIDSVQTVPSYEDVDWKAVDRLDVRPGKGVIKVRMKNRQEIQLDAETGRVLHIAERRSDVIEDMHSGAFFGKWVKYGIFLTAEVLFFIQLLTGIYLFVRPLWLKNKRKRAA